MERFALIWGSVGLILLILLDETAYRGRTLISVTQVVSKLQGEIYCNTLKFQELGFTKWAIVLSYAATFTLIVTILAVLIFLVWMLMKRTSEQTDVGTQVIQEDFLDDDGRDALINELNLRIPNPGDSFVTDVSCDSFKPMDISPVLGSLEPAEDTFDTFDIVKSADEHSSNPFEFFQNIVREESMESSVLEVPPTDATVKKRKRNYSSEVLWDLSISKNQRKRTATAQTANLLQSRVGIEIFTSYLFVYIQDLVFPEQVPTDYDD